MAYREHFNSLLLTVSRPGSRSIGATALSTFINGCWTIWPYSPKWMSSTSAAAPAYTLCAYSMSSAAAALFPLSTFHQTRSESSASAGEVLGLFTLETTIVMLGLDRPAATSMTVT